MKRYFFILLLTVATVTTSFAQKYGHVNFGNLLSEMPEVESAEAQLQAYEKEQLAIGEGMVEKLKADFAAAQAKKDDTTPKELATIEAKLQKDQAAIQQFEQQMGVNIEKKRQELLGPIIQKAKDAVNKVAKDQGYQMVFDSSVFGSIMFAQDATDLTPAVRTALGIK
ncbi:OmpH family outer membrane protein [Neolewinella persica]|uniref:OmpH family outer membrane protein n=1 Tax=Neolewinella persica TaxID=70998 RepID=UPI00035C5D54|nr:OmpH family outer membrane protein [Neolewinella persica]